MKRILAISAMAMLGIGCASFKAKRHKQEASRIISTHSIPKIRIDSLDQVIRTADKYIKIKPDLLIAKLNKAEALYAKKEYDKSIEEASSVLNFYSICFEALLIKGNCHYRKRDLDKAISCYEKIIETDNSRIPPVYNLGLALYFKKDYDKAIEKFNKVIKSNPDDIKAYFNRGKCFEKKEELSKAIEDYQKVAEMIYEHYLFRR